VAAAGSAAAAVVLLLLLLVVLLLPPVRLADFSAHCVATLYLQPTDQLQHRQAQIVW
jgi:hypothetical protein